MNSMLPSRLTPEDLIARSEALEVEACDCCGNTCCVCDGTRCLDCDSCSLHCQCEDEDE